MLRNTSHEIEYVGTDGLARVLGANGCVSSPMWIVPGHPLGAVTLTDIPGPRPDVSQSTPCTVTGVPSRVRTAPAFQPATASKPRLPRTMVAAPTATAVRGNLSLC